MMQGARQQKMIGMLIFLLAIPVGVLVLLWIFRVRAKRYLLGLPIAIIFIPILFGLGIYAFRTPIQQGKFIPQLGPFLSLLFPAEDLYTPLAEHPISINKNHYTLNVSHKYFGNHALFIEVYSYPHSNFEIEKSINVKLEISESDTKLLEGSSNRGSPFRGRDGYGFFYIGYRVPSDSPTLKNLTAKIVVDRDFNGFIKKYKTAKFVIRKKSDL